MLIFFIVAAIIISTYFYRKSIPALEGWRKYLLISLRSISIIIIFILLINPILYLIRTESVQPKIIVLNDVSESMLQTGRETSKQDLFEFKKIALTKMLRSEDHEVIEIDFANGIEGNRNSTNLRKTLVQTFKKHDPQNILAIILISDGWFNDTDLEIIDQQNIPFYTIDPEFETNEQDILIQKVEHNRSAFVNEPTPIKVSISAKNFKGKAKLELISNQQKLGENELDFMDEEFKQILIEPTFSEVGFTQINFQVKTDSSEINLDNNIYQSAIQVKREHSQNLVISDKLNWDAKFIISALNQDQRWKSRFLLKDDLLYFANRSTQLEDELQDINVLTLINYGNLSFSQNELELIIRFVQNGGGLFLQGKPVNELNKIIPTLKTKTDLTLESTFELTKQSEQYNTFANITDEDLNNIPPVKYYLTKPKIESEVLATFNDENNSPAILFSKFEQGKVLNFSFRNFWKWQLWNSGNAYNDLMLNIFSWLGQTGSERFYSTLSKNAFYTGEEIRIDLHAFDETLNPINDIEAELKVFNSSSKIVYTGYLLKDQNKHIISISDLPAGNYSYAIVDNISKLKTEGNFVVSSISPESRDLGINLPLLSYISNITGGKVISEFSETDFPEVRSEQVQVRSEIPVYKKWYIIAIFLISFCLELFLRKRWGLL